MINSKARKFLSDAAGKEFLSVSDPDHPFVFRGPNILLSMPDNLCAVFIPTTSERNNPIHLAARLIATRLAYPANTRCMLLFKPEDEHFSESFRWDFSGSFRIGEQSFRDFLYARGEMGHVSKMPRSVQEAAIRRFDAALRTTKLAAKIFPQKRTNKSQRDDIYSLSHNSISIKSFSSKPRNRINISGSAVSLSYAKPPSIKKSFAHFGELQLVDDYSLDGGVPYLKKNNKIGFIVSKVSSIETEKVEKLSYATAFCGLAILPNHDPNTVEIARERFEKMEHNFNKHRQQKAIDMREDNE